MHLEYYKLIIFKITKKLAYLFHNKKGEAPAAGTMQQQAEILDMIK